MDVHVQDSIVTCGAGVLVFTKCVWLLLCKCVWIVSHTIIQILPSLLTLLEIFWKMPKLLFSSLSLLASAVWKRAAQLKFKASHFPRNWKCNKSVRDEKFESVQQNSRKSDTATMAWYNTEARFSQLWMLMVNSAVLQSRLCLVRNH